MPDNIWIDPVTVCIDFPKNDCRQNDKNVKMHVKLRSKNPKTISKYANFQKNGNTSVEVCSEKEEHSKIPDDSFLHRELSPNDG